MIQLIKRILGLDKNREQSKSVILREKYKGDYNVLKFKQEHPQDLDRIIAVNIAVVGTTFEGRQDNICEFSNGTEQKVELVKEPNNPHDKNAVKVMGNYKWNGKQMTTQLGYIDRQTAKSLVNEEIIGATLECIYLGSMGKNSGVRITIWGNKSIKKEVKKEVIQHSYDGRIKVPKDEVDRNIKGQELEGKGYIENAIEMYEANVRDGFDGSHPYDRLCVIYRRQKKYEEEIRVLNRAIEIFEALERESPHTDVNPKLQRFRERLKKAIALQYKNCEINSKT